jgi:hypothetical protein
MQPLVYLTNLFDCICAFPVFIACSCRSLFPASLIPGVTRSRRHSFPASLVQRRSFPALLAQHRSFPASPVPGVARSRRQSFSASLVAGIARCRRRTFRAGCVRNVESIYCIRTLRAQFFFPDAGGNESIYPPPTAPSMDVRRAANRVAIAAWLGCDWSSLLAGLLAIRVYL